MYGTNANIGIRRRNWFVAVVTAALHVAAINAHAADQWLKPTAEELSMTSLPGQPGAPAVILFREEITKDDLHVMQHYERIKVLTEKGKQYANVELRFAASKDDGYYTGDDKSIGDISGRTIHADGTVIPFTGKPYKKTLQKGSSFTYEARVFTLPDVEVGSIIEYRYATRISDNIYEAPSWFIQNDLYTKKAHFMWYPTTRELDSSRGTVSAIHWFPILPDGVDVKQQITPSTTGQQHIFQLTATDIAPQPEEEYMPPIASFTYRVMFYYSAYRTPLEFWKAEGKRWSKQADNFAGPDGSLKEATEKVIAGAATQDAKLRKIYAAVMGLENTDYTRDRGQREDKAEGLGKVSNAGDVYKRRRGSSTQLTELFAGMARAAGMKAYLMLVPDRSRRLFVPAWLEFYQFDAEIAIVSVDGKDVYFDPGERYCEYGHLAWQHSTVQGVREVEGGTDFGQAPSENYNVTKTGRVADLTMDEHGEAKGTVTMTYTGSTALRWRQRSLTGDEESLKRGLRTSLEELLPKTMEVKVDSIDNVADIEKPLTVKFDVRGAIGTVTGKRMILPADLLMTGETNTFPHEKRDVAVYFPFPQMIQDAVRIKYPASMTMEGAPTDAKFTYASQGQYTMTSAPATSSITVRRNFLFNTIVVQTKDYDALRQFYAQFEAKDKGSIVLKVAPAGAAAGQ